MEVDYSEVGFSNNFMFGKLMEKPERAKAFLEQILNIKIDHIEYVIREKQVDEKHDGRSIRLDIYVDDGNTIYDCEMQTANTYNLSKRSRYYQSMIDISLLKKNDNFRILKRSYIIFICTFDPFGHDQCIYHFENTCVEVSDLQLKDEAYKIFINTKGSKGNVSEEFRELLRFIDTSEDRIYHNELANNLLSDLKEARNNTEWRDAYMTWTSYGNECLNEGIEQGTIQERIRTVENLLSKGKSPKEIAELLNYDIEFIISCQEKIKHKKTALL